MQVKRPCDSCLTEYTGHHASKFCAVCKAKRAKSPSKYYSKKKSANLEAIQTMVADDAGQSVGNFPSEGPNQAKSGNITPNNGNSGVGNEPGIGDSDQIMRAETEVGNGPIMETQPEPAQAVEQPITMAYVPDNEPITLHEPHHTPALTVIDECPPPAGLINWYTTLAAKVK